MYYEEKIVGGVLQCRYDPRGDWTPVGGAKGAVALLMVSMPVEEQQDIINLFQKWIGVKEVANG